MNDTTRKRQHILTILNTAIGAADPYAAVKRVLSQSGKHLVLSGSRHERSYILDAYQNIWVAGCGKAGAPMARALEEILGERLTGGIVTVKRGGAGPAMPAKVRLLEAGHPEPDEAGSAAAAETIELLSRAGAHDLIIAPISGGGSALWPQPVPTVTLGEKRAITRLLLESGADIREINTVRKHLSSIKGGLAARHAQGADVIVIAMSDVVGDALETIASGPFAPDPTTFDEAWRVLDKYHIMADVPLPVRQYLFDGQHGRYGETPKEGDAAFEKVTHVLCATNRLAINAAADKAKALGYQPVVAVEPVVGESREAARAFALRARSMLDQGRGFCLLSGGEPTVTLGAAHGKGGRNQEFALSAAFTIENSGDIVIASCGTDGTDGPTDAAGAMADGATLGRGARAGLDAHEALNGHDAYPFFDTLGDLIRTGPTNTNVMDIQIALVGIA